MLRDQLEPLSLECIEALIRNVKHNLWCISLSIEFIESIQHKKPFCITVVYYVCWWVLKNHVERPSARYTRSCVLDLLRDAEEPCGEIQLDVRGLLCCRCAVTFSKTTLIFLVKGDQMLPKHIERPRG